MHVNYVQQFPAFACLPCASRNPFGHWARTHAHMSIWFRLELKHLGPVSLSQSGDLSAFFVRIFALLDFYVHIRRTTACWKQKEVPQEVSPARLLNPYSLTHTQSPYLAHHFYCIHNIAGGLPIWPRNCRKSTPRSTQSTWPSVFINEY